LGVAELKYDFSIAMSTGRANNRKPKGHASRTPLRHFIFAIGNAELCGIPRAQALRPYLGVSSLPEISLRLLHLPKRILF
jgi:hypothetical protein